MPLISIKETLRHARFEGWAVPLFDVFEMAGAEGIFAAIGEKKAPAIVAIYDALINLPHIPAYVAFIRAMAEQLSMPVSLMLDHGSSEEHCLRALSLGFSDIMYDGSRLPLEQNIVITKRIVNAAHKSGAGVEAELGHVGEGSDYERFGKERIGFTDPKTVLYFLEETGVDYLAIAIGSAHGIYKGDPHIDIELLKEIRSKTNIPLVLHGGTGLSQEQYRSAVKNGICKINIATDLILSATERMVTMARSDDASYLSIVSAAREAHKERALYYFDLFGASGKGHV